MSHVAEEDEGQNLLAELVWWARRKRTAFLGRAGECNRHEDRGLEEDWRHLALPARSSFNCCEVRTIAAPLRNAFERLAIVPRP